MFEHVVIRLHNTIPSFVVKIFHNVLHTKHYIINFPISFMLLHSAESSRRIQCKNCRSISKHLLILHHSFCCPLYILPQNVNFISLRFALAHKPVTPDRHNKNKTHNLKPQAVILTPISVAPTPIVSQNQKGTP